MNMVPTQAMADAVGHAIESTLLRSRPKVSGSPGPNKPLFHNQPTTPYADSNTNPFFRYQQIQRVNNRVTTRSNVYAVWVTIGYFEVTRNPAAPNALDNCEIGLELGSEGGSVQRHRSFYMIDRSIPVGFKRGEALNAENTILLRRHIE